jgi:hypothetical protein
MKKTIKRFSILLIISIGVLSLSVQAQSSNSISGFVFDNADRSPIAEIYVELLDEVYSTLRRAKTDGSGRYFF